MYRKPAGQGEATDFSFTSTLEEQMAESWEAQNSAEREANCVSRNSLSCSKTHQDGLQVHGKMLSVLSIREVQVKTVRHGLTPVRNGCHQKDHKSQVLARKQRKGNCWALLVGM